MTRDEMITVLIEDKLNEWAFGQNTDSLEERLEYGFKGFGEYSDEELKQMIEDFEINVDELLEWRARRLKERENDIPFWK